MVLLGLAGTSIQLVPDGTLLFHLALVVVMVALLNITLLRPINRILEERERRTKGRLTEAQSIQVNLSAKLREYESRIREARSRGYMLLEEERTGALRERDRRVAELKADITCWLDDERSTLQIEEEEVKGSLRKDAAARALEISVRILGRPIRQ